VNAAAPLRLLAALCALSTAALPQSTPAPATAATAASDDDVVLAALVTEVERSRTLKLQDLEQPYFVQYGLDDQWTAAVNASFGAVESSSEGHSRVLGTSVRIGSPQLDNTNFSSDDDYFSFFGSFASVPIEDDLVAIRDALWTATDAAYKSGVETLTKKRAYMADKTIEDRPADFTEASPSKRLDPRVKLVLDRPQWEDRLARISSRFKQHLSVQDADVSLSAEARNRYLVNTEGTRLRVATRRATLVVNVSTQAPDGMRLADRLQYTATTADELPSVEAVVADIDALVVRLEALGSAPKIDHYSGPVLFDGPAAALVFRQMLGDGLAARPEPVGTQRAGLDAGKTLEKKLGSRILPASFRVYDDPTVERVGDTLLVGHYDYDDEGVAARRLDLVTEGKLTALCLSRAPTKKLSGSNGHGRRAGFGGSPQAGIGCVFVEDEKGLPADELKQELVQAAIDAGLEYAIRVEAGKTGAGTDRQSFMAFFMGSQGGASKLSDPLYAYKVDVADGHEELIRGCEFAPVNDTILKHIVAAGRAPAVDNGGAGGFAGFSRSGASSVVAPSVVFEELDLSQIEQENDKLPYLPMPLAR
jgi:predicted Zn-dependent protease